SALTVCEFASGEPALAGFSGSALATSVCALNSEPPMRPVGISKNMFGSERSRLSRMLHCAALSWRPELLSKQKPPAEFVVLVRRMSTPVVRTPVLENEFDRNTSGAPPDTRPTPPETLNHEAGSYSNDTRGISTSRPS